MTRTRVGTVSGWLRAGVCAALLAVCTSVAAQTTDVPQSWVTYAQLVGHQFEMWLEAGGDASQRLHRYLEARGPDVSADASSPIAIRAWIGANGVVTRVDFATLGSVDADAALRQLLVARALAEAPPPDMLQPLRMRLQLIANPQAAAASDTRTP
ncbi:YbaB/EbfC family DNA-binding protein [Burkholderia vietnamiensis]|nr:YbaB/EbfC family DNA-binding protein [Burkholderia vietnamiensis]